MLIRRSHIDGWIEKSTSIDPLTRKALDHYQLEAINQLLGYARDRSVYYSYLPACITTLEEFRTIPFTTEENLLNQGERMVLVSQSEIARIITMETSGTTGTCKRLFYTKEDQDLTVQFFSCGLSELVSRKDRTMICMPYEQEGSIGALIVKALKQLEATSVLCGIGKTFREMYCIMSKEGVDNVIALPMHILSLGRWMKANQLTISLKSILISADSCPKWLTQELEETFHCQVFTHYGSRESGLGGAVECSAHEGMHVREKDLYIEIVDEAGNVLPNGEFGELVITTLHRQAMPLIRYRTKDYTRILSSKCPCGGETLRLDKIIRKEGHAVQAFDQAVFSIKEVIDYKISKGKEAFTIEALITKEVPKINFYNRLKDVTKEYFPSTEINLNLRIEKEGNCLPCYLGKRCICAM